MGTRSQPWSVLWHVYPDADVPVVQFSIDEIQPASFHFELGKKLAALRDERILLIMGSGNLIYNLHTYTWGQHMPDPYDWTVRFEAIAKEVMLAGEYQALVDYEKLGRDALLSIPTPDHYLPLLYVIAASRQGRSSLSQSKAWMANPYRCWLCGSGGYRKEAMCQ
jgi:4,5-DOPA dioxygenase extradiol